MLAKRPKPGRSLAFWLGALMVLGGVFGLGVAVGFDRGRASALAAQSVVMEQAETPRPEPPKPAKTAEKVAEKVAEQPAAPSAEPALPASAAAPSEAVASASAAPVAGGPVKVTVSAVPAEAKVFRTGRVPEVGPVTYEVAPGTKVMVEVMAYGYQPKRLVLDGSKTEVSVVLLKRLGGAPASGPAPRSGEGSSTQPAPPKRASGAMPDPFEP